MILQWIRNRLWKRRRLIFRYHDGKRVRAIDPIIAATMLHEHTEFLNRHLGDAVDGDRDAIDVVSRTACDVFDVQPLSADGGLTVAERLELMLAFDLYLIELKKNIAPSLTSPVFTESTLPHSSEPTTKDSSDSGSTDGVKASENPNEHESVS